MRTQTQTTIVLLCGPPGSGKTTLARHLLEHLPDAAHFASDELRRDRYRRLWSAAREAAGRHPVVILDATYYRRAHRDRVRALGHPMLVVHLVCPIEECLIRNQTREPRVPAAAVRNLWGRMEAPTADERPVRIDPVRVRPDEAARRVIGALRRLQRGLGSVARTDAARRVGGRG